MAHGPGAVRLTWVGRGSAICHDPEPAPPTAPDDSQSVSAVGHAQPPGFRTRGRVRRRVRFLRKARELAYRDLGGLVFNLHRFGQRNDALVIAKLSTLSHIDAELRSLETALGEHQPVTVLREAGITACPRCAAIHSGEDRFCPNCGLPMDRHVDLPIAGTPASGPATSATGVAGRPDPADASPNPRRWPHGRDALSVTLAGPRADARPVPPREHRPSRRRGCPAGGSPVGPPVAGSRQPTRARPGARAGAPGGEEPTEIIRPPRLARERCPRLSHRPRRRALPGGACPLCGSPLHPEQEWCLRCGAAARTRLATSSNWRAPIVTVAVVATLSLGVLAAALVKLAGNFGSTTTPTPTTVTAPPAVSAPRRRPRHRARAPPADEPRHAPPPRNAERGRHRHARPNLPSGVHRPLPVRPKPPRP